MARLTYINRLAGDAKRQTGRRKSNTSTGPNRRVRTAARQRTLFIIACSLRRPGGAPAIGCKRVTVTLFLIKLGPLSHPYAAARNYGEELPELVERAHVELVFLRRLNRPRWSANNV